ncbi:hypothetical protein C8Q80DRAFT_559827 [Daedaleopsis nitida]|nr:hypothetical protein C8Q80DRAFT_559827 [Daedaleopsis nitida]
MGRAWTRSNKKSQAQFAGMHAYVVYIPIMDHYNRQMTGSWPAGTLTCDCYRNHHRQLDTPHPTQNPSTPDPSRALCLLNPDAGGRYVSSKSLPRYVPHDTACNEREALQFVRRMTGG